MRQASLAFAAWIGSFYLSTKQHFSLVVASSSIGRCLFRAFAAVLRSVSVQSAVDALGTAPPRQMAPRSCLFRTLDSPPPGGRFGVPDLILFPFFFFFAQARNDAGCWPGATAKFLERELIVITIPLTAANCSARVVYCSFFYFFFREQIISVTGSILMRT